MYKRAIIIIFLLSTLISSKPVYAQEASGPVYIVQSGDSLSSIAEFFSVSINELMSANGISDPNQLDAVPGFGMSRQLWRFIPKPGTADTSTSSHI